MARPTVARIDLNALAHNVEQVRRLVGERKICAAVKADAYGHGAAVVCHALSRAGVDLFGVAMTEEAVELRCAGIRKPIFLLTAVPPADIDAILEHRVSACVTEETFARELSARALQKGVQAPVHVKVDTGMRRVGVDWQEAAAAVCRMRRLAGLHIDALFSHFACADADDLGFCREQVRRFNCVLGQLRRAGLDPPLVHMANSNGVMRLPEAYFTGVRPGLMLYGMVSRPELRSRMDLRPALSMQTAIAHIKSVPQGEKIGYGHTFATWRPSVIATLPIGYHDGYIRQFSNTGQVLVRGRRAPVVGRVCMDQALIDVTDVPGAQLGDEVVIYGRQGEAAIDVEEMACRVDRIPYELTCAVSPRVRREFVLNGAVVVQTPFVSLVPTTALNEGFLNATAADERSADQPAELGAA